MTKAGGIVGLIGSILGFLAAIITLLAGGFVTGLESMSSALGDTEMDNSASTQILTFAFLGIVGSFATIVTSALLMSGRGRITSGIQVALGVISALAGGTFVAVCMILVIIGGVLGLIGGKPQAA